MPTRFYLQSSGTPKRTPAFNAGWEQTAAAVRVPMPRKATVSVLTALTDSAAITIPITTTQQIAAWQGISDEVFLPVNLDASVLFSLVVRCSESAISANAKLAYSLRALAEDGANTVLGTLASSLANVGTEFALTGAPDTRIFGSSTTVVLTPLIIGVPWRLVLEIGAHAQAPTAAQSFIQRVGCNAASDFALTSALATDLNPWMELSVNLQAVRQNNYQHVRAGSDISVSERIR